MRTSFLRRQRNADLVVLWPGLRAHLRLLPKVDPELRDVHHPFRGDRNQLGGFATMAMGWSPELSAARYGLQEGGVS